VEEEPKTRSLEEYLKGQAETRVAAGAKQERLPNDGKAIQGREYTTAKFAGMAIQEKHKSATVQVTKSDVPIHVRVVVDERPPRSDRGDRPPREAREPREGGDRPYKPREDRAPREGGDRPYKPREGGDRPYKPREGGDRAPREGGDRPYKPREDRAPREGGDRRGPRPDGPRPDGPRPSGPRPATVGAPAAAPKGLDLKSQELFPSLK
jgi:hypothetical protein